MKYSMSLLVLFCLIVLSCENDSTIEEKPPKEGDNFTFFESNNLYGEALQRRSDKYSAPFEIRKVERSKGSGDKEHDFITVTVEHEKACSGNFEIIWTGAIMESYPPQTHIAIRYNATCTGSGQLTETVLLVDLDEFIGDEDLVNSAIFHIINSSKVSATGDVASEPVSSN